MIVRLHKHILVVVAACWFLQVSAQSPGWVHFDEDDGLPSYEVYDVHQAHNGHMWFGTDRGIARYDGYEFHTWNSDDNLEDDVFFDVFEDDSNRMWFCGMTGRVYYFDPTCEMILPHAANDQILETMGVSNKPMGLYVDSNRTAYFAVPSNVPHEFYIKAAWDGTVEWRYLTNYLPHATERYVIAQEFEGGYMLVSRVAGEPYRFDDSALVTLKLKDTSLITLSKIATSSMPVLGAYKRGNQLALGWGSSVVRFSLETGHHQHIPFDGMVGNSFYLDEEYGLWIGSIGHSSGITGVFYWPGPDWDVEPVKFLEGRRVSCVHQDREGGMWFTTLDDGVYYMPTMYVQRFVHPEIDKQRILAIFRHRGVLYSASEDADLYTILSENEAHESGIELPIPGLNGLRQYGDTICMRMGGELSETRYPIRSGNFFMTGKPALTPSDTPGFFYAGHWARLVLMDITDEYNYKVLHHTKGKVYDIVNLSGSVLIGTASGLLRLYDHEREERISLTPEIDKFSTKQLRHSGSLVLIGTKSHGAWLWEHTTGIMKAVCAYEDVGFIRKLANEGDTTWWILGEKSLVRAQYDRERDSLSMQKVPIRYLLGSRKPLSIHLEPDRLWIGTNRGIILVSRELFSSERAHPITLSSPELVVGDTSYPLNPDLLLRSNQRNVRFSFSAFSMNSRKEIRYHYRMQDLDETWQYTTSRTVDYPQLPYGDHTFSLIAEDAFGNRSEPIHYTFAIQTPFWLRWYVRLSLILVALGLIAAYVYSRFRNLERANELVAERLISEQKALKAQVAPHFLFNAINSILGLLAQNRSDDASQGLGQFAGLLRKLVDNSDKTYILLEEELEAIHLYLDVEQMRFDDGFEVALEVDSALSPPEIEVPAMLLQPLVENAIWHGLLPKKVGRRILNIEIGRENDTTIYYRVIDNGIGFEASKRAKQRFEGKRKSKGLGIVRERIRLINLAKSTNITLNIHELPDQSGTEAVIKIPIL